MKTHLWLLFKRDFQEGLTEEGNSIPNVSNIFEIA